MYSVVRGILLSRVTFLILVDDIPAYSYKDIDLVTKGTICFQSIKGRLCFGYFCIKMLEGTEGLYEFSNNQDLGIWSKGNRKPVWKDIRYKKNRLKM